MIKTIIRKEIQVLLKEKGTFFWLFLMPMLFILMFASIFSNAKDTFTIHYYDADRSAMSQSLVSTLGGIKGIAAEPREGTLEEEIARIKDGKATSLLVIPQGFESSVTSGQPAKLELYRDASSDTAVAPVLAVMRNVTAGFRDVKLQQVLKASGRADGEIQDMLKEPVTLSEIKENSLQGDAVTQYVPGFVVMFVFFIIITMVRNFFKDQHSGMLARLRSTPMKPYHYLIGMWVPNILAVIIQCVVLLAFGKIVYDVNLGDPLALAFIVLGLAVCTTGIGLAICMFVKSENQGTAYTQIITMGGAVVAGLWFPYEIMPDFAQAIGKFTPQYWAQHGFQNIMIRGMNTADIWKTIAVLAAYGAAGLLIASLRYKKYLKNVTQ
ncbi:ABC transporter permease [Gorillibacterium sp. sgz5001074]|uniref:ABC transporter permease n=1 Tax=Gorillibacterium sp. sgz5001074 TaxID=3446695 RepID=UPI003F670808